MAHLLFAEWDGGGVVPPEVAVVRRTVEAGQTVTVLGDPVMAAEVRAAGVGDFRPWRRAPHHVTRRAEDDFIRDWEVRSPLAELDRLLDVLMVGPAPLFAAETLAAIDDVGPDVVVSSFMLLGAQLAAEVRGVPSAVLVPNTVTIMAEGMTPPGMLPLTGPLGRLRDRVVGMVTDRLMNRGLSRLNDARVSLGLARLHRLRAQWGSADRVLALTSEAFDFPCRLPANVRYVGAPFDDPGWAEPLTPPVADERPFVLVAMSSTFMDHVDVLQRVVTALNSLPVRGLVTTGHGVDPGEIRARSGVTVVRSAPLRQVLAHTDVLVTHGGHGTVIKGLAAGVPIVCMPLGRDQPENAARLVFHQAGVRVSKKASPAKVAAAVRRVLHDSPYRASAARLGERIRAEAAGSTVLVELESLVPH